MATGAEKETPMEGTEPAPEPKKPSLWARLVQPRFIKVQFAMSPSDGVPLLCWTFGLISKEDYEFCKNEKDRNRHNHYLVEALCKNETDESFYQYIRILESILAGRRYRKILEELKGAYLKETGMHLRV